MQDRYIVFQAYGNEGILMECKFALMQLLKHNTATDFCVVLYTDHEDFFTPVLQNFQHFEVIPINSKIIKQWRGAIDFVHRIKIEMLIHFAEHHKGAILYFDTDTYCKSAVAPLFDLIEQDQLIMHTCEGSLDDKKSIVFKKWSRFLTDNNVTYNSSPIGDTAEIQMWNAGVLGFSNVYLSAIKNVLKLTDRIYPLFPKHTVEQFAFSYIFQKQCKIESADTFIFHYWDLKEYKQLLTAFFEKMEERSLEEQTKKLAAFLPQQIFEEKQDYNNASFIKKLSRKRWDINNYIEKL